MECRINNEFGVSYCAANCNTFCKSLALNNIFQSLVDPAPGYSSTFSNVSIHICGGIGSQFLRYLAGVGVAIKSNIPASDIKVIFHPYDELHTPTNDSLYHNSCLISHFLDLPSGSLDFEPYNKYAKQFNFDNRMLILVLEALRLIFYPNT